jgi:hypothetical protein
MELISASILSTTSAMDKDGTRRAVERLDVEDEEHRQARIRMLGLPGFSTDTD